MRKVQFTIDDETAQLLEDLAAPRAGNKSYVVREAVKRFAEQEGFEQYLDWLEQQPPIRQALERGLADVRAGRTTPHEEVLRKHSRKRRR
jgi:predicted transcriptional regulator